jgi:hypothetical protein
VPGHSTGREGMYVLNTEAPDESHPGSVRHDGNSDDLKNRPEARSDAGPRQSMSSQPPAMRSYGRSIVPSEPIQSSTGI